MPGELRGRSQRDLAFINDLMATTSETTTVWTTRAGDPNMQIHLAMPPEAMELAYEHAAREFAAALGELERVADGKPARDLTVDELYDVQGELERATIAVDALFKARPAAEWESDDDG